MEEENNQEESNKDVPVEEVNKVIEDSGFNKEVSVGTPDENPEEYKDLTEDEAKEELDSMVVPENEGTEQPKEIEQPEEPKQEKIEMSLLQFQCIKCNFKSYCNLEDDVANPLPELIKCINCGKKKAIKKRIFNMTINSYKDVEKQEETVEEEVTKEE